MKYELINEEKVSFEDVEKSLLDQKSGSVWAEKTSPLAINYAKHLNEVFGDNWYKGFIRKEDLLKVMLPKHGHLKVEGDNTEMLLFPQDTPVLNSKDYYKNPKEGYPKDCLDHIASLKEDLRKNGFIFPLVLVVINGELKHVDGLHRMVALSLLLDEGYEYKPISVFVCDNTRIKA